MARKRKTDSSNTKNEGVWFSLPGNCDDVVISTRARLARNLADFPFPSKMTADDKSRVQSLVYDAFSGAEDWRFIDMTQISLPGKQILSDKNILDEECGAAVINYGDESSCCLVNGTDHIKIASFTPGLDCEKAMEKVYKVDEFLQNKLQFAANIDFGYLTSQIKDCGTGLKFTVRLFIPSIVLSGQFDSIVTLVQSKKMVIKPVFKSEQIADFSNCLFDVYTSSSAEGTELDQMAGIHSIVSVILKRERKIRSNFADNNPTVVLNFFKQSYARAMYSLLLSYEEAVSIISAVKWGLQLKLIKGISEYELNGLYYRVKDGHLKYLCDNYAFTFEDDIKSSVPMQIKRLRTIVIQQAFEGIVNEKSVS
jgi:protein arginine kinase